MVNIYELEAKFDTVFEVLKLTDYGFEEQGNSFTTPNNYNFQPTLSWEL